MINARSVLAFAGSVGSVLLVAGCVASPKTDYPLSCMAKVNPPGSYGYPAGVAVPTVIPEAGGTQAGADAVNACIQAKAAAAGQKTVAAKTAVATHPAQTTGKMTTKTYTYGTPPSHRRAVPTSSYQPNQCSLQMTGGSGYTCTR